MVLEAHMVLFVTARFFEKNVFAPKMGENELKMGEEKDFLLLKV